MDNETLRIIQERQEFTDNIIIEPYADVKATLDKLAAETAKDALAGLSEMLSPLIARAV